MASRLASAVINNYLKWNDAVSEAIFPLLDAQVPVYLEMTDEVLQNAATQLGYEGDALQGMLEAVKGMVVNYRQLDLSDLLAQQRTWANLSVEQKYTQFPPSILFLSVLALAAGEMGGDTGDFTPNAFYPRVGKLLEIPYDADSLQDEYRSWSEYLWRGLNAWLTDIDGARGTPTAFSLGHRYVGLAVSQALVRKGDRSKLPIFFASYGLGPGMELAAESIELYLDAWVKHETCPASAYMKQLWKREAARERISSVVAVELLAWDGTLPRDSSELGAVALKSQLLAHFRQGFRGESLDLALSVRQPVGLGTGSYEFHNATGEWLPLSLQQASPTLWRTRPASVDTKSLLEGAVRIRPQEALADAPTYHHPRPVVPLTLDELHGVYLEQDRLQLNIDSMLLVNTEARGRKLLEVVVEQLELCARSGFVVHESIAGLPSGWSLVTNVQLYRAPNATEIEELRPHAVDQLAVAGGFRIPSRIRKWVTSEPPEIRVSATGLDRSTVNLSRQDAVDTEIGTWPILDGAMVLPLKDLQLVDGDYVASLYEHGRQAPLHQVTIRLRSADMLDANYFLQPHLYNIIGGPGHAMGVLSAEAHGDLSEGVITIDGTSTTGAWQIETVTVATDSAPWLESANVTTSRVPQVLGVVDPKSCVATGAHQFMLPPAVGRVRSIEGTCMSCGLTRRWPGYLRTRRVVTTVANPPLVPTVAVSLPPVVVQIEGSWDAALEALKHLGGGEALALDGIARQVSAETAFVSSFARTMEHLGHISITRDQAGRPSRWEVTSPQLTEVVGGKWLLMGHWFSEGINELTNAVIAVGGALETIAVPDMPSIRAVSGLTVEQIEELEFDCATVPSAGYAMLQALPPLSWLESSLSRTQVPGFESAERFDVNKASWVETGDIHQTGAFRLRRGFENSYWWRSNDDVASGEGARIDAYTVKHLAALSQGVTLATYSMVNRTLAVPLGASLPGLYARAATLFSGQRAREESVVHGAMSRKCEIYSGLDAEAANLLVTLLTS